MKTYAEAGVDTDKEGACISALISQIKFKRDDFKSFDMKGHFSSLIDMGSFALSINADGVGTKVLIADAMQRWDTVGIDCIAMNVNDAICVGAEPIAFVDYLAVSDLNEEKAKQIGIGLNKGAELANISIIGGETATLPELINGFDLAGVSVGIVQKDKIIFGSEIENGDIIIGLKSSGIHSNGLTLARKVFEENGYSYLDTVKGERVGDMLLEPTEIYVKDVLSLIEDCEVHGLANITGGGLKNILRLKDMKYVIDNPIEPQPIFKNIQELGDIEDVEMYKTFNMGMGFVIIANENKSEEIIKRLGSKGKIVGHVEDGKGVEIPFLKIRYEKY